MQIFANKDYFFHTDQINSYLFTGFILARRSFKAQSLDNEEQRVQFNQVGQLKQKYQTFNWHKSTDIDHWTGVARASSFSSPQSMLWTEV